MVSYLHTIVIDACEERIEVSQLTREAESRMQPLTDDVRILGDDEPFL